MMMCGLRSVARALLVQACVLFSISAPAWAQTQAPTAAPLVTSTAPDADKTEVLHQDPRTGLFKEYLDLSIKPSDDFYRYANGHWLDTAKIPGDHGSWGPAEYMQERTETQLKGLIENLASKKEDIDPGIVQRVGDLYASFMDEAHLETLGATPLDAARASFEAVATRADLWRAFARCQTLGLDTPLGPAIGQDDRDATRYMVQLEQGGLGLPDRDYYLDLKDPRFAAIREKYVAYISALFTLANYPEPEANARKILALETRLAKISWNNVQLRDAIKSYNKYRLADLERKFPGFDAKNYLDAAGVAGKIQDLLIGQPSYTRALVKVVNDTPLATWRAYLRWQLISAYANDLSSPYVKARFEFVGRALNGVEALTPRATRAIATVDGLIGQDLGQLYVAKYFPPESKASAEKLVANLLAAYRQSIEHLDWMTPATREAAQAKLAKITVKIGYPNRWMDYSGVLIKKDDLVGNRMRVNAFMTQYQINKLGHEVDRQEWEMTPQTINAYYNEIVFPAAILQPPYFLAGADDAANYGAIGATIGHEISHGFDDQGALYDGDGNLHQWWVTADASKFKAKTQRLVAQYSAFEPVNGYHVNGAQTLGENIADIAGLAVAYEAYHISLGNQSAPVIDGLTGDQRFFIAFAQSWVETIRDDIQIVYLKSDPHSPDRFRVKGSLMQQDAFYDAFHVVPGDPMYLPPGERVKLW
jgi:predicted metalloendopeptidase